MSSTTAPATWMKGIVKAVPSGDCLVIVGISARTAIPPEKTITLSSLMAPRLARRDGVDEPFAWESREFLRKLCIGKEVVFKVDYTVQSIQREFGTVYLNNQNVARLVVAKGWAKVREQGQSKGEASPDLAELQHLQDKAEQQGLGRYTKEPGASEASIRSLPPSAIGDSSNFDALGFLDSNKGKPIEAIVEQVRDGSTLRVYLLPEFQFVQVFVAGIMAPSMGKRRTVQENVVVTEKDSDEPNGEASGETNVPLTSADRLKSRGSLDDSDPKPFAKEAKHFTEIRVLNRDVRVVLEGVDKYSNLIGSVYYSEGESLKDLAMELVENGLAEHKEWSANMMDNDANRKLKSAELEAKTKRLRMWVTYVNKKSSTAIHNQNFTGKVVEVVSGDCIIVADDSIPFGDPSAERRVNLSSIRSPKIGNPRSENYKPEAYSREAKEFLRSRIIGKQVNVAMEYSRNPEPAAGAATPAGSQKVMNFGSVFVESTVKPGGDDTSATAPGANPLGVNVAELLLVRGFASVVRHRDFEDRSNYYDALLAAESRARNGRKGLHSGKEPSPMHINDLTTAPAKKCKDHLAPFLRERKIPAVVEYVFSGHRCKLLVPSQSCSIAFSLSGVRCPGKGQPFSEEAIAFMRRKIMQRDVEIDVEFVDNAGTFLGSMWESKTNIAVPLLEAGLAKFQPSYNSSLPDARLLTQAELSAKMKKLKIWENYVEGEETSNGSSTERKHQKEELKVTVTEVLGGGKFYVQSITDQRVASIQNQLASLSIKEAPVIGAFHPKSGELVLAQFIADNSWNRALIVKSPTEVKSASDSFEVFYVDYGNQETVAYSQIRPLEPSLSSVPFLAQLCTLAYIKVPDLEADYGQEAAYYLSELTLSGPKEFRAIVEERDNSGGKVKGQGTGPVIAVTLIEASSDTSVNAALLKEGLARMEKRRGWQHREAKAAIQELEKQQDEAKTKRLAMWEYGDAQSDDEDNGPPARKPAGKK